MWHYFHNSAPQDIALSFGALQLHYYGLILAGAMALALWLSCRLAKHFDIKAEMVLDLGFWLIISGLIGARLYHVALEWSYYSSHQTEILMVWQGGLAIHGGVMAGALALYIFSQRFAVSFWKLAGTIAPGLLLAQGLGRWGNYFNQELFGRPTSAPWGIYIDLAHRPLAYSSFEHFQPTFFYEFLAALIGVAIMLSLIKWLSRSLTPVKLGALLGGFYLVWFGLYRGLIEFIKIDSTPIWWRLRWPQLISLLLILAGGLIITWSLARYRDRSASTKI